MSRVSSVASCIPGRADDACLLACLLWCFHGTNSTCSHLSHTRSPFSDIAATPSPLAAAPPAPAAPALSVADPPAEDSTPETCRTCTPGPLALRRPWHNFFLKRYPHHHHLHHRTPAARLCPTLRAHRRQQHRLTDDAVPPSSTKSTSSPTSGPRRHTIFFSPSARFCAEQSLIVRVSQVDFPPSHLPRHSRSHHRCFIVAASLPQLLTINVRLDTCLSIACSAC